MTEKPNIKTWYDHAEGGAETDQVCEKLGDSLYRIDGQNVELPVIVRKARNAFATFLVDSKAAQEMITDSGFEIVELWPGKAILQVIGVEYIDNDLGNYHEAGFSFYVRQPGAKKGLPFIGAVVDIVRGKAASYIHLLPVNQDFTKHAGRFIWGYPKWNTDVRIEKQDNMLVTNFCDQGQHVFTLRCKLGGKSKIQNQQQPSLSVRQGITYRTVGIANGSGVNFYLGGEKIELGDHPIADELRKLGLPKKPVFSGTIDNLQMNFGAPVTSTVGVSIPE